MVTYQMVAGSSPAALPMTLDQIDVKAMSLAQAFVKAHDDPEPLTESDYPCELRIELLNLGDEAPAVAVEAYKCLRDFEPKKADMFLTILKLTVVGAL